VVAWGGERLVFYIPPTALSRYHTHRMVCNLLGEGEGTRENSLLNLVVGGGTWSAGSMFLMRSPQSSSSLASYKDLLFPSVGDHPF